jgi:hypothetical protein
MARLADLLYAASVPRCPACRRAMQLEREQVLDEWTAACELTFVCVPCGEHARRVKIYDLD